MALIIKPAVVFTKMHPAITVFRRDGGELRLKLLPVDDDGNVHEREVLATDALVKGDVEFLEAVYDTLIAGGGDIVDAQAQRDSAAKVVAAEAKRVAAEAEAKQAAEAAAAVATP